MTGTWNDYMIASSDARQSRSFSFHSQDLDEARSLSRAFYHPLSLDQVRGSGPLGFSFNVTELGPVTIGDMRFGADVRLANDDLETAYHVNVQLSGQVESVHRGHRVIAGPDRAAVYQPVGTIVLPHWGAGCHQICVKVDRRALESELEALLGRPVPGPIDLAPSIDLARGPGRTWASLIRLLAADIRNRSGLLHQPAMSAALRGGVLAGLLLAVGHPYREQLAGPVAPARPRTVKRAIDAMEADPGRPFVTADLARIAGVSARALQDGFRQYVGLAPMTYLRRLRLTRAHEDLRRAAPGEVTVAEVAHRWGFAHLGRFADAYHSRYGAHPSTTLRSPG
jgi:AraC-like DNA-binding protein